jgi:hypothetical protein
MFLIGFSSRAAALAQSAQAFAGGSPDPPPSAQAVWWPLCAM